VLIYRVRDLSSDDHRQTDEYRVTCAEARDLLRATPGVFRGDVEVSLWRVKTPSVRDFAAALNGRFEVESCIRAWRGTTRGGLREIALEHRAVEMTV
jgi:hypothetical protein